MSVSLDTNALAQQIKEASLNDKSGANGASEITQDDKYRVYVGNLSFETAEDDLKKQFAQAGEVVSISMPTKRNYRAKSSRPAGIAFVGYTNDADVQKAVDMFNGKTYGDRELSVAVARPLQPRRKSSKQDKEQAESSPKVETTSTDEAAPATEKKRSRKPRSKKSNGAAAPSSDEAELASGDTDPNVNGNSKPAPTRLPRERGPPNDGVPSTTTLFVAGLDHKTTDAELLELFSTHNPTSAHVALRPIQRYMIKRLAEKGEQRLGRGFGFVTFADQAAQTKALEAMNGHKSGDRELAVKVAIDSVAEKEKAQKTAPTGLEKSVPAPEGTSTA